MRFLLYFLFLSSFIISCKDKKASISAIDYTGYQDKSIILTGLDKDHNLSDTLGIITLKIPSRLDTFYQWHDPSDCIPCGRIMYRFADKRYKQFAEAGFLWTYVPESVYQLTIIHNPIKETPDSIQPKPLQPKDTIDHLARNLSLCDTIIYVKKEFREINKRPFIITEFTTPCAYLTNSYASFVIASTHLKNRKLNFVAQGTSKDTIGFIDHMYRSILSVKIEEK